MSRGARSPAGPKVLILGEDSPAGLMPSFARAFARLGSPVETYCLVRAYRGRLGRNSARIAGRAAQPLMLERFNRRVRSDLRRHSAELVLVLKGERLQAETVSWLKDATGGTVVNYYPDDPFSDERANKMWFGPSVLTAYDHCFTFASNLLDRYAAIGVRSASWLPFARDPDLHSPVPPVDPAEFDVVFAGNLDEERVRWLEPLARRLRLLILAEHRRDARGTALKRATFAPSAFGPDLPIALSRAAISLNIMRLQNRLNHNMRSFESPACGAFTLSQRTPELERLFSEGNEIAFVDAPEDLVERAEFWLAHPRERERIARLGFQRVARDTYDVRGQAILSTVGLELARSVG